MGFSFKKLMRLVERKKTVELRAKSTFCCWDEKAPKFNRRGSSRCTADPDIPPGTTDYRRCWREGEKYEVHRIRGRSDISVYSSDEIPLSFNISNLNHWFELAKDARDSLDAGDADYEKYSEKLQNALSGDVSEVIDEVTGTMKAGKRAKVVEEYNRYFDELEFNVTRPSDFRISLAVSVKPDHEDDYLRSDWSCSEWYLRKWYSLIPELCNRIRRYRHSEPYVWVDGENVYLSSFTDMIMKKGWPEYAEVRYGEKEDKVAIRLATEYQHESHQAIPEGYRKIKSSDCIISLRDVLYKSGVSGEKRPYPVEVDVHNGEEWIIVDLSNPIEE